MERIRILLAGENEALKTDFFGELSDSFECMTTSCREADIKLHLQLFKPKFFLYCMHAERKEEISKVIAVRSEMDRVGCALAAVGTTEDLGAISSAVGGKLDVSIGLGISTNGIKTELVNFYRRKQLEAAGGVEQLASAGIAAPENSKKHVLVIDDDPMMLKLVKEHLHEKYQVATAINGRTANKFLESKTTDLILLDYEMPGESGPEVLKQFRANPRVKDVPVIFLTGVSTDDKIREALAQKPQGYLLKPIDKDKLLSTISKFL